MLTPQGWREDVTVTVDAAGMISQVEPGRGAGAEHLPGIALPAMPNVHSHAHQRFMLGLAERAGPGTDSFWTWREAMYGFALRLSPDDLEAVAKPVERRRDVVDGVRCEGVADDVTHGSNCEA